MCGVNTREWPLTSSFRPVNAALRYSLISPPRTRRRSIRAVTSTTRPGSLHGNSCSILAGHRHMYRFGNPTGPFPVSARPARNQTRVASSPGIHTETSGVPGRLKAVGKFIGVACQAAPRADPAWPSAGHARRGTRHSGPPRPRNGNPQPSGHASRSSAGRATRRQLPLGPRESHLSAQAPSPAADRNASPRCPPGTPASRGTRVPRRAPGSALPAKPEWAPPRTMSVAVREKADGAHRPSWRPGRRPLYVRGHRNASTHGDTPR